MSDQEIMNEKIRNGMKTINPKKLRKLNQKIDRETDDIIPEIIKHI